MEPTPFNLQYAIDQYIASVNNQGSLTNADVLELTAHLYDATDELKQSNLTEEEAFLIATKRIGKASVLTEEYGKVNPSIQTNKIWAYLFIGFNLLGILPYLIVFLVSDVYYILIKSITNENLLSTCFIVFNLGFSLVVWFLVLKKDVISTFIEKQVASRLFYFTALSFLPWLGFSFLRPLLFKLNKGQYLYAPIRELSGSFVELTFCLGALSLLGGITTLLFSLRQSGQFRLNHFFEKPSYVFLIIFGILIECVASITRTLRVDLLVIAFFFGLVYFMATFLISYYNKISTKYIIVFAAFGFIMETSLNISNDLDRGNFNMTISFVSALVIGVLLGRLLAKKYRVAKVVMVS